LHPYPGTADETIYSVDDEPDDAELSVRRAYAGQAPSYGNNPYDGADTAMGGLGSYGTGTPGADSFGGGPVAFAGSGKESATTWVKNTSFLSLEKKSKNNNDCSGGYAAGGGGGAGGYTGGGGGSSAIEADHDTAETQWTYGAGGGGGSSMAIGAGAGVTLPSAYTEWQSLGDESPSQIVVTVHCESCGIAAGLYAPTSENP